jgi:ABC-type nickel/cobalt efflux system permease component RcnA
MLLPYYQIPDEILQEVAQTVVPVSQGQPDRKVLVKAAFQFASVHGLLPGHGIDMADKAGRSSLA